MNFVFRNNSSTRNGSRPVPTVVTITTGLFRLFVCIVQLALLWYLVLQASIVPTGPTLLSRSRRRDRNRRLWHSFKWCLQAPGGRYCFSLLSRTTETPFFFIIIYWVSLALFFSIKIRNVIRQCVCVFMCRCCCVLHRGEDNRRKEYENMQL